jgi:hypothetical protein
MGVLTGAGGNRRSTIAKQSGGSEWLWAQRVINNVCKKLSKRRI